MTHRANAYAPTVKPGEPCPRCDDTGIVEVRRPDLDSASPSGEAWVTEWCDCLTAERMKDAYLDGEVEW